MNASSIAYTVTASMPDEHTRLSYIAWLTDGHLAEVVAGGAKTAAIVVLDRESPAEPFRVETRYTFATRERFNEYIADHAPALREEGKRLFVPLGVSFTRTVGEVL